MQSSGCRFEASCSLPVSQQRLFAYHDSPGALQRLLPPWQRVTLESSDHSLSPDSVVVLRLIGGPLPVRWVAVHGDYDPPNCFEDFQQSGPFAHWHHRHLFVEDPASGSTRPAATLTDQIEYRVRFGHLGQALAGPLVHRQLESMFRYRHRVTRDDLLMFDRNPLPPQRIAVSGASGLVGKELCGLLSLGGHQLIRLVRDIHEATEDQEWSALVDPGQKGDTPSVAPWHDDHQARRLDGVDAVIHLAGKSIADRRWSPAVKQEIRDSRVIKTRQLCERLAALANPPKTLLCASATGIYGDRGDQLLHEASPPGDDFLAEVAQQWEDACRPAADAGIRVVNLRFGVILSPRGGALAKMLLPTKLGLGGPLGSGRQWWSWIGIDDTIGAIYHALATPSLSGPVNLVSPHPLTNAEFAKTLAAVLRRPALLAAPAIILRLALGEMADSLLLASTRVEPAKLSESGYHFRFTNLRPCLEHLLGRAA